MTKAAALYPMEETKDVYFISRQRVSSYELDSFGHVNNSVFLNYLERARGDFLLSKDLRFADFSRWDRFPVVTHASLDFKAPAFADDNLLIKGRLSRVTATSFTMDYEIFNSADDHLLLTGQTVHVFVNNQNRPSRIPDEFKQKFIDTPQT